MIQMQGERHAAALGDIPHVAKKRVANKIVLAGVNGNNRRRICRFRLFHHGSNKTAIRHVKCADSKTMFTGGFK